MFLRSCEFYCKQSIRLVVQVNLNVVLLKILKIVWLRKQKKEKIK